MSSLRAVIAGLLCTACGRLSFDAHADARVADGSAGDGAPIGFVVALEAEAGLVTGPFAVASDPNASGGFYVIDGNTLGSPGPGDVSFTFSVARATTCYVWGRTRSMGLADDSFWIALDGSVRLQYLTDCVGDGTWRWMRVSQALACPVDEPVAFSCGPGLHTLQLSSREGQSAIDRIVVTDDASYVPGG